MNILIYPILDYVCAECGYHMFCEKFELVPDMPLRQRLIYCLNDDCVNNMKKAIIKPIEVEVEIE